MVRAILEGRKTQTRRVANQKLGPLFESSLKHNGHVALHMMDYDIDCPYGAVGERLWVRETWQEVPDDGGTIVYRATDPDWEATDGWTWRPSIFMCRAYSRMTLEVTDVRVQRLQEIAGEDAVAEGWPVDQELYPTVNTHSKARDWYKRLWDSLNAKRGFGWATNPWVWCITFR